MFLFILMVTTCRRWVRWASTDNNPLEILAPSVRKLFVRENFYLLLVKNTILIKQAQLMQIFALWILWPQLSTMISYELSFLKVPVLKSLVSENVNRCSIFGFFSRFKINFFECNHFFHSYLLPGFTASELTSYNSALFSSLVIVKTCSTRMLRKPWPKRLVMGRKPVPRDAPEKYECPWSHRKKFGPLCFFHQLCFPPWKYCKISKVDFKPNVSNQFGFRHERSYTKKSNSANFRGKNASICTLNGVRT